MDTQIGAAAVAGVISVAFSLALLDRWLLRRQKHLLAWLVSILIFAGASVCLWVGASFGWTEASFRAFFLLGGILSVPPLALGTLYLLGSEKIVDRVAIGIGVFSVFALGVLLSAPTKINVPPLGLPNGSDIFTGLPRLLSAIASISGTLVILIGTAVSLSQRNSQTPNANRKAAGVALIAIATIVLATGGFLNSLAEEMTAFSLSLALGATLLFTGFMLATFTPAKPELTESKLPGFELSGS